MEQLLVVQHVNNEFLKNRNVHYGYCHPDTYDYICQKISFHWFDNQI
jgi:hypothetical protein